MKFPKTIRHRKAECKIYGKKPDYPFYRVAWYVTGQRRVKQFAAYSGAKGFADKLVKDLAEGSQATALAPMQATDALAAVERLKGFYQQTGRNVSLLRAVSEYVEAASKLNGTGLNDAVEGYLSTVAVVRRKDVSEAVTEFVSEREALTKAHDGQRAQLSLAWHLTISSWLREFAGTFPGNAVCDLNKSLVDIYVAKFGSSSAKTRNERRNALRLFFKWCVAKDYLSREHRLGEASQMRNENAEPMGEIELYSANDLRAMLEAASMSEAHKCVFPVIALVAFGGCRQQEAMRLHWENVFREDGHIEISKTKAKTRARRLIEAPANLFAWLEPYRHCTGPVWTGHRDTFHAHFRDLLAGIKTPMRDNGLRHAFISHSYALDGNENRVAMLSGNSPGMVHRHYKGLLTRKQAEAYFDVRPKIADNIIPMAANGSATP